jgi:N-acetylglucosamine kinase-like BadF-type ATPase
VACFFYIGEESGICFIFGGGVAFYGKKGLKHKRKIKRKK